jgi:hypothetical protein
MSAKLCWQIFDLQGVCIGDDRSFLKGYSGVKEERWFEA